MTIDEAIEDLKENDANHIAEWLEELKAIKESTVFYSNRPIEDIVLEARADAIEQCAKIIATQIPAICGTSCPIECEWGTDETCIEHWKKYLSEQLAIVKEQKK